jgi:hypothetical protein
LKLNPNSAELDRLASARKPLTKNKGAIQNSY